jgi:hypothetical protein
LWALDVAEGHLDDDFSGRRWEVDVKTAGESREAEKETREDQKADRQRKRDKADDTTVVLALDRLDPQRKGAGYTKVRQAAVLNSDRMTRAIDRLSEERIVEELPVEAIIGNGAKRTVKGLRRCRVTEHPNIGTEHRDDLS